VPPAAGIQTQQRSHAPATPPKLPQWHGHLLRQARTAGTGETSGLIPQAAHKDSASVHEHARGRAARHGSSRSTMQPDRRARLRFCGTTCGRARPVTSIRGSTCGATAPWDRCSPTRRAARSADGLPRHTRERHALDAGSIRRASHGFHRRRFIASHGYATLRGVLQATLLSWELRMGMSAAGAVLIANGPWRLNEPAREACRRSLQPPWGATGSPGTACPFLRGGFNPLEPMVEFFASNQFRSPHGALSSYPGGGRSCPAQRSRPIPASLDTHRR
jgi:hypothetical protein